MNTTPELTAKALIAAASAAGLNVSQRTLRLYSDMGLIPKPTVRNRSEGGRTGYYDQRLIALLKHIAELQSAGHTLQQIKTLLDGLADIASQRGRDAIEAQIASMRTLTGSSHQGLPVSDGRLSDYWRLVAGPVFTELVRRGLEPDTLAIAELSVTATTVGGETIEVPLYLSPQAVHYSGLHRPDYPALAPLISGYWSWDAGEPGSAVSADDVAHWLEKNNDMSPKNVITARRANGEIIGFVALGVERERLRAGQVRLHGPYVAPEYRRQGVGGQLAEQAETLAGELGARYVDTFVRSDALDAIGFLSAKGYHPAYYVWQMRLDLDDQALARAEKVAGGRSATRLVVRPLVDRGECEQALALQDAISGESPGHYPLGFDDLIAAGVKFPNDHLFAAWLDGKMIATLWNSTGSNRVYATIVPEYQETWAERALWAYLVKYGGRNGMRFLQTELTGPVRQLNRAATALGFSPDRIRAVYRKLIGLKD